MRRLGGGGDELAKQHQQQSWEEDLSLHLSRKGKNQRGKKERRPERASGCGHVALLCGSCVLVRFGVVPSISKMRSLWVIAQRRVRRRSGDRLQLWRLGISRCAHNELHIDRLKANDAHYLPATVTCRGFDTSVGCGFCVLVGVYDRFRNIFTFHWQLLWRIYLMNLLKHMLNILHKSFFLFKKKKKINRWYLTHSCLSTAWEWQTKCGLLK